MSKKIIAFGGIEVHVNGKDFDMLSKYKWHIHNVNGNVQASVYISPGKTKVIKMHRLILGLTDPKIKVDHKNQNKLDNRRCNLRLCTDSQNSANIRKRKLNNCVSIFKGANFHKQSGLWFSRICVRGERIHLGYFKTEIEAAKSYDKAAVKYFGRFASINSPAIYKDYKNSLSPNKTPTP